MVRTSLSFKIPVILAHLLLWGCIQMMTFERMTFLVDRCAQAREHDGAPDVVHTAGDRVGELAGKIADHVPLELRGTGDTQRDPGGSAGQGPAD